MTRSLSWEFVERFRAPPALDEAPSWGGAEQLVKAARRALGQDVRGLDTQLAASDRQLARLGGDPSRKDWASFRPLALLREEDWSDWLAWLIETSTTGRLAACLLDEDPRRVARIREMRREMRLPERCRADLVFQVPDHTYVHIEVKVGDDAYEKTYDTGEALRAWLRGAGRVRDLILLPLERHVDAWQAATESHAQRFGFRVKPIRWTAVSRGIRDTLSQGGESPTWEAWAYGFAGAVEQVLLGIPRITAGMRAPGLPLVALTGSAALADILKATIRSTP